MIKAIVFDFFGVITASDPYWAWLQQHVAELDDQREAFQRLSNQGDRGEISYQEFKEQIAAKTGQTMEEVERMDSELYLNQPLLDYIKELRDDYAIGILTNSTEEWVNYLLSKHNLFPLFDEVVVSSSLGLIKPQPAIFEHMLACLDVKASETVFVDDRERNVEAAKQLGIPGVVFKDVPGLKQALHAIQKGE